jgi:hypothetical protein
LFHIEIMSSRSLLLLLFRAAQRNDLAGVLRVLETQNEPIRHQELQLALRVAVRNDCVSVVVHMRRFMRRVCQYEFDLLGTATRSGSVHVLRNALEMEPPIPFVINACLEDACLYGHKFAAQCLVTYKADVNPQGTAFTPLYCAAYDGRVHVVMWLLQTKALVKPPSKPPWLAIARAWNKRHKFIVRLLDRAVQVNGRLKSRT